MYRADSDAQFERLLGALPTKDWIQITVTPLEPHPNDPTSTRANLFHLPDPRLTPVYRLEATVGEPVDLGAVVRAVTQLETAAPGLGWLNKGVFVSVGGRQAAGVIYETYLVG